MRNTLLKKRTQKYWLSKLSTLEYTDALNNALAQYEGATPSDKLLNYLFNIVSELTFASYEEQEKAKFDVNQLFADYSFAYPSLGGRTIHLESDIADDTLGIKPKFIKKFINTYGLEGFKALPGLFWAFNYYIPQYAWSHDYFDNESAAIDWNAISYFFVNEETLTQKLPDAFFNVLRRLARKDVLRADEKTKEFFLKNPYLFPYFERQRGSDDDSREFFSISSSEIEKEIEVRSSKWKKLHNVVPQSALMLFVEPEKFSPTLLPVIETLFGSKQIARLSPILQWRAALLIECFGELLLTLPTEVLAKGYIYDVELGKSVKIASKETIDTYLSILPDQKFGDVIALSRCSSILANISPEFIKKVKKIETSSSLIQSLLTSEFQNEFARDPNFMSFVMEQISPRDLKVISDYYSGIKTSVLKQAYGLWNDRVKNKIVPLLRGKVDEYSWEIIDTENDASGIWVGNATDCCQALQNHAESCVKAGYLERNCSFIAVRKNGKVYAQTFLWIEKYRGIASFDSIEMLSRSAAQNPKVMKCFLEAAIKLIETKTDDLDIRCVITGASGTTLPEGLRDYDLLPTCDKDTLKYCSTSGEVDNAQRDITPLSGLQVYTDCHRFFTLAVQDDKGKIILSDKGKELLNKENK